MSTTTTNKGEHDTHAPETKMTIFPLPMQPKWHPLEEMPIQDKFAIITRFDTKQHINQPTNQSIDQTINQTINQTNNQSNTQAIKQSIKHSIKQSIKQSNKQSIKHSINQTINQSINQSNNRSITSSRRTFSWGSCRVPQKCIPMRRED